MAIEDIIARGMTDMQSPLDAYQDAKQKAAEEQRAQEAHETLQQQRALQLRQMAMEAEDYAEGQELRRKQRDLQLKTTEADIGILPKKKKAERAKIDKLIVQDIAAADTVELEAFAQTIPSDSAMYGQWYDTVDDEDKKRYGLTGDYIQDRPTLEHVRSMAINTVEHQRAKDLLQQRTESYNKRAKKKGRAIIGDVNNNARRGVIASLKKIEATEGGSLWGEVDEVTQQSLVELIAAEAKFRHGISKMENTPENFQLIVDDLVTKATGFAEYRDPAGPDFFRQNFGFDYQAFAQVLAEERATLEEIDLTTAEDSTVPPDHVLERWVEGVPMDLKNGQRWVKRNGKPVRLK